MRHPQYNPALAQTPLDDDELEQLESLLSSAGDEAMSIEGLDGYLTALLLAPALPESDIWLPRVWGGEPDQAAPFVSGKQTKRVVQMVLRHMASIDRQLQTDEDLLEPFFAVAEREASPTDTAAGEVDADDGLVVDASEWCIGFLCAVDLLPEFWDERLGSAAWADELAPIVLLGADPDSLPADQAAQVNDPLARDQLSRRVPDAISALWRARGST